MPSASGYPYYHTVASVALSTFVDAAQSARTPSMPLTMLPPIEQVVLSNAQVKNTVLMQPEPCHSNPPCTLPLLPRSCKAEIISAKIDSFHQHILEGVVIIISRQVELVETGMAGRKARLTRVPVIELLVHVQSRW